MTEAEEYASTEVDRLLSTFATLDAAGVVARANFTCGDNCGHTEIGTEAEDGAHGHDRGEPPH